MSASESEPVDVEEPDADGEATDAEVSEAVADVEEPDEDAALPDVEGDEIATLPGMEDVAEQVEETSGASDPEGGDESESGDESAETEESDTPAGDSIGDLYVDVLAVVLAAVAEEYEGEEPDMSAADIGDLARGSPISLNAAVDDLAEEMAGTSDMDPKTAVTVSTGLLVVMVLVKETDVASSAISGVSESLNEVQA